MTTPDTPTTPCPKCGTPANGRFCSNCGTEVGAPTCPHCQAELRRGARFCHRCGKGVPGGEHARTPWIIAWSTIAVLISIIVWYVVREKPQAAAPQMANNGASEVTGARAAPGAAPGTTPPDISQMSPRERFDRLYDRIVAALEQNDSATVIRFSPMAFAAYAQLDQYDALARFDVGTLHATLGDLPGASALADSILKESPHHLFGYMLEGTVAEFKGDKAALERSYRDFLASYDAEIKSGKPEYKIHQPLVDDFRNRAQGRK